jgi:hypothetical protein
MTAFSFDCPRLRKPVAALLLLVAPGTLRADVFSNVPEADGYNVAYELAIPVNGAFQGTTAVPYSVNNSTTAAPAGFDRVAYYLELTNASGTTWVYTSMDAFTTSVTQTGLPHAVNNPVSFQQAVSNLTVFSNVSGVQTGSFDRGQIEMWHNSYSQANAVASFAASATTFDWGDTMSATASGYGSFQIHNPGAKQAVLCYNRWANSTATNDDVGIGPFTGTVVTGATQPDWTFGATTANYTSRKLVVLVRPKRFTVTFTSLPLNQQVTPRNLSTNNAVVPIAATETTGGFEKAVLKVFRNGVAYGADTEQTLTYTSGSAPFSFNPTIPAELASYRFEIYLKQGTTLHLVRRVSDVTAGDVLMWYGQSNSEAAVRVGSANAYASPWIRTFGMSSDDATVTQAYPFWVQGDGDGSRNVPAGVGQWALVVGKKIVDTYGIPVAILNGSRGGYSMPKLQRDDADLNHLADTGTTTYRVYNRLRYRAIQAKVASGVRAIFYYQGESDVNNATQHMDGFASLMEDWQVDYPAVEKVFVTQLHVGCSTTREQPALRDAQRLLPEIYEKVRVNSSNGLTAHTDNCHYPFVGGYETHGLNVFRQVARDLYGAPDGPSIDPPNPHSVEWANPTGTRLRIVLQKPGAQLTVDAAALPDFRLNGSSAVRLSSSVTNTAIELQYDSPVTGATSLDYLAHIGNAAGWVRNANGVGLLTFSEPITSDLPFITVTSPSAVTQLGSGDVIPLSATVATSAGTVSKTEVFVDGILYASAAAGSISSNWTVPSSGTHKIVFRATISTGRVREETVIVFAGPTASPAGIATGLKVWLKPEAGIIRDANGLVSAWQDSSGNGNHCVQATDTLKPTYQPNRFGTLPGVRFAGDDWMASPAGMSTGSYTKIVRVLMDDFILPSGNILSSGASSGTRHALYMAGSTQPRIWHSAPFVTSSGSMLAGRGHVIVATYDGTTKAGKIYLDGILTGSGTATANTSDASFQLGAIGGGNFMKGAIGEAIIYNRVLTDPERTSVEGYLVNKISAPADAALLDYNTWSATTISPPADATPNGDANGNGIRNAVEFALKLDPGNLKPLDVQAGPSTINVRYFKPTDRTGVGYQLLESFDLQNWNPVTDLPADVSGGFEERFYSRSLAPQKKSFYKLRVTVND